MTRPYRTPEKIERAKALRRRVYEDRAMWECTFDNEYATYRPYKRPTFNALVFAIYSIAIEDAD